MQPYPNEFCHQCCVVRWSWKQKFSQLIASSDSALTDIWSDSLRGRRLNWHLLACIWKQMRSAAAGDVTKTSAGRVGLLPLFIFLTRVSKGGCFPLLLSGKRSSNSNGCSFYCFQQPCISPASCSSVRGADTLRALSPAPQGMAYRDVAWQKAYLAWAKVVGEWQRDEREQGRDEGVKKERDKMPGSQICSQNVPRVLRSFESLPL